MNSLESLPIVQHGGFPNCQRCQAGEFNNSFRLSVKNSSDARAYLFHVHANEGFQSIILRLCQEFPETWSPGVVYYFYVDLGGLYHPIEEVSWLKDKDIMIVSTVDDVEELPSISLNAVHASLRPEIELRPHQVEGVERMIHLEHSAGGGILADEMGLGKTIQALTLVLRQQPRTNIHAPTLVIVPSHAIIDQWGEEIRTKTTYGSLPYIPYLPEYAVLLEVSHFRVVLTTYDKVRMEYKLRNQGVQGRSPLFDTDWHRIILDESHKVRERTILSHAVIALKGRFKWCLTGTPFQNDITELYPIFSFLGIEVDQKRKHEDGYVTGLLQTHMIRRTKAILKDELNILPRQENRITLEFSEPERALYTYLERMLYHQIMLMKDNGDRNHHAVSAAILYLRLKQICGHHQILIEKFPDLIPMAQSQSSDIVASSLGNARTVTERSYYEEASEYEQALEIIESYYNREGALQEPLDLSQLQKLKFIKHSTKAQWLVKFLRELLSADPTDKIVVVSQFVDVILKIAEILDLAKISFTTYHGSMNAYSRQIALNKFNHNPIFRVMLMSLKAGGIGLNLQRANHMIILDRWWNPATMDQATARIHRMNQVKATYIHTVVIKDTIEESLMDKILDKKNALFNMVVGGEGNSAAEAIEALEAKMRDEEEALEVKLRDEEEALEVKQRNEEEALEIKLRNEKEALSREVQEKMEVHRQLAKAKKGDKGKRRAIMEEVDEDDMLNVKTESMHDYDLLSLDKMLPENMVKIMDKHDSVEKVSKKLTSNEKKRRKKAK